MAEMGLRPRAQGIMNYLGGAIADFANPAPAKIRQSMTDPRTMIPMGQGMGPVPPMMPTSQPNIPQVAPMRPAIPDMQGAGVRRPPTMELGAGVRMTPEMMQKAEQAAKMAEMESKNPEIAVQPSFMDTVSNFFGDRENMLRLALAFNSMRYQPDAGLASVIGDELQDIRKTKIQGKTVGAVVSFLRAKGYNEYAKVVEQNPALASSVYEQVIQKELKPGATAKTSGVQYDAQGRAFVNVSEDGDQRIEFLKDAQGNQIMGETTQDKQNAELAAAKLQAQYASAQKYSDAALKKADNLSDQLDLMNRAIDALGEGAQTGPVDRFLPTFRAATAELETIANELGITVINSATFGALSESELRLALDTNLPLGLNEGQLKAFLKRKMAAISKLRAEILNKAIDMRTMGYDDYIKKQRDEAQENVRFMTPPPGFQPIGGVQWDDMTLQQKKEYERLSQ